MLTDAGPLVAVINRNDQHHQRCIEAVRGIPDGPLVSTGPCFTEAMHILGERGGHPPQATLWTWWRSGRLTILDLTINETEQAADLMARYRNVPMDLADASIVALAERLKTRRVFTIDGDFHIYRLSDGSAFDVFPGD